MLANPLPLSLLDPYSLSTSSLGCYAFCIVINFLVLWSICLSSSLVDFKNGPEESPGIYPFDKVPAIEFFLEFFLALLRYSF